MLHLSCVIITWKKIYASYQWTFHQMHTKPCSTMSTVCWVTHFFVNVMMMLHKFSNQKKHKVSSEIEANCHISFNLLREMYGISGGAFEKQCVAINGNYFEGKHNTYSNFIVLFFKLVLLFNSHILCHCFQIGLINEIWSDIEYGTVI